MNGSMIFVSQMIVIDVLLDAPLSLLGRCDTGSMNAELVLVLNDEN